MKALIVCSVHALCDVSQLEQEACNRACARHGIPAMLTGEDHAGLLETASMLDVLRHLPVAADQRQALITSYVDLLNDEIWGASLSVHQNVFAALLDPGAYAWQTGFVSDYPLLTTNLIRSAALLTNATKLGTITALSDPLSEQCVTEGLATTASALDVHHSDVDVLVAHQRDFDAARSLGMHPRFLEEQGVVFGDAIEPRTIGRRSPRAAVLSRTRLPQLVSVPA